MHREALASLALFRKAADQEKITLDLAERLVAYLRKAQHDPDLKFRPDEPPGPVLATRSIPLWYFPPVPPPLDWPEEILQLLGKVPDKELGRRFGIARATIAKKRHRLGIPSPTWPRVRRTRRVLRLLGLPTREAARRLNISPDRVVRLRKRWNLPSPSRTEWRWTPEILARLGREADTRIARDTGFGFRTVRGKRQALGIPPYSVWRLWSPEEEALLGTAPDEEIAERLGRSATAVANRRAKLGIPDAWEQ